MDSQHSLEAVIINYRSPDLTVRCVESLLRHGIVASANVIVIDNKSPDSSLLQLATRLRDVTVVASQRNGGFGAGVNLGVRTGSAEYILVLNPDTYFESDSVSNVLALMTDQPNIAIGGLDLVDPDGVRQYSGRRFYSLADVAARRLFINQRLVKKRIDLHLMKDYWERGAPFEAEWVMGTGFIMRRDVFEELGGMDEDYFLYMEDVDLCARVWEAGYSVVCVPGAQLVHDHQRASASNVFSAAPRHHMKSLLRFARKFHFPIFTPPGIDGTIR